MTRTMPPTRSHSLGVRPLRSLASREGEIVSYIAAWVTSRLGHIASAGLVFGKV